MNKNQKRFSGLEKFTNIVRTANKLNMLVTAYQIIGHIDDSIQNMISTLQFLSELNLIIGSSIFYLVPKTNIEKKYPIESLDDIKNSRLTSIYLKHTNFSREDIFTLFLTTRIINFLKNLPIENKSYKLSELIKLKILNPKIETGFLQLHDIINEGNHYLRNKKGKILCSSFSINIFNQVFKGIKTIAGNNYTIINDLPN